MIVVGQTKNKYGSFSAFHSERRLKIMLNKVSNLSLERTSVDILEKEKYSSFIDIGAGFGYFSMIAAHYADTVLAFEPHALRYGFCLWNTKELSNVIVFNKLIGTNRAFTWTGNQPNDMIGIGSKEGKRNVRLSDLNSGPLSKVPLASSGIIKIDVEGNEEDVIKSAGNLSKYENYIWLIEIHLRAGIKEKDVLSPFISAGYQYEKIGGKNVTSRYKIFHENRKV